MNKDCHEHPENSGALLIDRKIIYILDYIYQVRELRPGTVLEFPPLFWWPKDH
ncbi:MAG: hypothetical protein V7L11_03815 [Nostoc sp.]|uniref:hypothetical protein n=1 Tax=Nostoc sp. TaxID=1180 RepID=UPI002FF9ED4E